MWKKILLAIFILLTVFLCLFLKPDNMATIVNFYSEAGDGAVGQANASWDTLHDSSAGNCVTKTSTYSESLLSWFGSGTFKCGRVFLPFITSGLPDNCIITSVTLRVYLWKATAGVGTQEIGLVQTSQADYTNLATEDFDQCGSIDDATEGASRISVTDEGFYTFTLNDTGIGWISKTATPTLLGLRTELDLDDVAPTDGVHEININIVYSDYETTDYDPKLSVTYKIVQDIIGPGIIAFPR